MEESQPRVLLEQVWAALGLVGLISATRADGKDGPPEEHLDVSRSRA
jgi:hypothetical protein